MASVGNNMRPVGKAVECVSCGQNITSFKTLHCLHSLCDGCVYRHALDGGRVHCPKCARESLGGIQLSIKTEEDASPYDVICDAEPCFECILEERGAPMTSAYVCYECSQQGEKLCQVCFKLHQKRPATREHKPVPLEASGQPGRLRCPEHPTLLVEHYCQSCQVLACSGCTLAHIGHSVVDVEAFACISPDSRAFYSAILAEAKIMDTRIAESLRNVTERVTLVAQRQSTLLDAITERENHLVACIRTLAAQDREALKVTCANQSARLENNVAELRELQGYSTARVAALEGHTQLCTGSRGSRSHLSFPPRNVSEPVEEQFQEVDIRYPDVNVTDKLLKDAMGQANNATPGPHRAAGGPAYGGAMVPPPPPPAGPPPGIAEPPVTNAYALAMAPPMEKQAANASPYSPLAPPPTYEQCVHSANNAVDKLSTNSPMSPPRYSPSPELRGGLMSMPQPAMHRMPPPGSEPGALLGFENLSLSPHFGLQGRQITGTTQATHLVTIKSTRISEISDVHINPDGTIYVVGNPKSSYFNPCVEMYDERGGFKGVIEHNLHGIKRIAAWNGTLFVTDKTERTLLRLESSGVCQTILQLDRDASGSMGLAIDQGGVVYISCTATKSIYQGNVGHNEVYPFILPKQAPCLSDPRYLCVSPNHDLVVSDHSLQVVHVYSPTGVFKHMYGVRNKDGRKNGKLSYPSGVACDAEGRIFVCDENNTRIVVLTPEANLIGYIVTDAFIGFPKSVDICPGSDWLVVAHGGISSSKKISILKV